jgi:hypothetical protein
MQELLYEIPLKIQTGLSYHHISHGSKVTIRIREMIIYSSYLYTVHGVKHCKQFL